MNRHGAFFIEQLRRELSGGYRDSGYLWIVFQALLLLAVYSFVFTRIFQARVPPGLEVSFVAYLAVAWWPWSALSEGISRNVPVIGEHRGLISKVAVRRELLVAARLMAIFIVQAASYLAVLVVLDWRYGAIHWFGLLPLAVLAVATLPAWYGAALVIASAAVFIRDLKHLVPPFLLLAFFATPIVWSPVMLPEKWRLLTDLNPFAWWVAGLREAMLAGQWPPLGLYASALATSAVLVVAGRFVFNRLAPHFEDYL